MRRGFFLNSAVLLLLIPLLLLLATYEDVSSQVIQAQSIRTQAERTYRVVSYLELDFQKALEISGKRAIVAVVDYVSVTGNFISPTYMVNNTIKDLVLEGNSTSLSGYNSNRVMRGQSLRGWLMNITGELNKQGFEVSPSIDDILNSIGLTVAPLDSFRIVIKARIPNITIKDASGRIVYTGSIPSNGGYIYAIVDLQNLEDPMFSAMTGGRYHRSIRACRYSFPEILEKPIKVLKGYGSSTAFHVVGTLSQTLDTEKIFFGDYYPGGGAKAYVLLNEPDQNVTVPIVFNTTLNRVRTSPLSVFNENDMGVLVFENTSGTSGGTGATVTWCSLLGYRLNLTIQNNVGTDLGNFQVPIYIDRFHLDLITVNTFFSTADSDRDNVPILEIYDENCNPINFWVEKWDTSNQQAVIWVNVTIPANSQITLGIYFDSTGTETLGDPDKVFDFYDDFSGTTLNTSKWEQYNAQVSIINGVLKITNAYAGIYTKKTFNPPVIIEFRQNIKNRWAELYIAVRQNNYPYAWGPLWWVRANWIQPASWAYLDDHDWGLYSNVIVNLPTGWHEGTIYWFRYNSVLEWDTGAIAYNPFNFYQDYSGAIALGTWDRNQEWDWIRVRKYASTPPTVTVSQTIETKPSSTVTTTATVTGARAYDIQPFINCIMDQRYFGIYNAPSFFERLEGSTINHEEYETLAHQIQDELGIKYGDQYYPIGLVSFMIPHATYDEKLFNLFNTLGIALEEGQTSFDYYFFQYYFREGYKVLGYRVYGISDSPDRSSIYFFLDNQTAVAIFGAQGAQDLLQR